jgi:hypothetical protein
MPNDPDVDAPEPTEAETPARVDCTVHAGHASASADASQ